MLKILDDQSIDNVAKLEPVEDLELLSSAGEEDITAKPDTHGTPKKGRRKALLSSYEPGAYRNKKSQYLYLYQVR